MQAARKLFPCKTGFEPVTSQPGTHSLLHDLSSSPEIQKQIYRNNSAVEARHLMMQSSIDVCILPGLSHMKTEQTACAQTRVRAWNVP